MKYYSKIALFLIIFTNFIIQCATSTINMQQRVRSVSDVNLRTGPGLNYEIITTIPQGSSLILLESKNDWHHVEMPTSGKKGWVFKGLTKILDAEKVVVTSQTYIRKGPGNGYKTFAVLVKGRTFGLLGEQGNWYYVSLPDGNTGWIPKTNAQKITRSNITTTQNGVVRVKPADNAAELVRVSKGTELIQLDRRGAWYLVRVTDGVEGWMHERSVRLVPEKNLNIPITANIRRGPGKQYDIIEQLSGDTPLTELERKDDWMKVRTPTGNTGWVYKGVVTSSGTAATTVSFQTGFVVTNRDCNIRQGYSTSFKKLARVKKGTILQKIGLKNNWFRIKYPMAAEVGWIRSDLVDASMPILFTNQECNIRQGYSTNFKVNRRISAAVPLAKISEKNGWYRVHLPDSEIGWIHKDLASDADDILVTNQDCNVRQGPGTHWEKIDYLKVGTYLLKLKKENDWYRTKLPSGKIGWLRQDLLVSLTSVMSPNKEANVRSGPAVSNQLLKTLTNHDVVYKIGEKDNWFQFRLNDGSKGWIREDLVAMVYYTGYDLQKGDISPLASSKSTVSKSGNRLMLQRDVDVYICREPNCAILRTAKKGTELIIVSRGSDWYEVRLPDGNPGWVKRSDVYGNVPQSDTPQLKYSNSLHTTSRVNVRSGPGISYRKITTIDRNIVVNKIRQRGDWIYGDYGNGRKGWIASAYLSAADGATTEPITEETTPVYYSDNDVVIESGMLKTLAKVKILEKPELKSQVITTVNKGIRLQKVGRQKDWFKVQLTNKRIGWVSKDYVDDISMDNIIAIKNTVLKREPRPSSTTLENIPVGTEFVPGEIVDDWVAVRSRSGNSGWVFFNDFAAMRYPRVYAARRTSIRTAPTIQAKAMRTLAQGELVDALTKKENWYLVMLNDGTVGWLPIADVDKSFYPNVRVLGRTKVYNSPSTADQQISTVLKGEKYEVAEIRGDWYRIRLKGGGLGWIYKTSVDEIYQGNLLITDRTAIREGPGVEYGIVMHVNASDEVKCIEEKGFWCKVIASNNRGGWINKNETRSLVYKPILTLKRTPVYSGPDTKYAVIRWLEPNQEYLPIAQQGNWYHIKLSETEKGWVKKEEFVQKAKSRLVFTLDTSNIRNGPGINFAVLATVEPATDLMVIGEERDWYKIKISESGLIGWIRKDLIFE